MSILNIGNGYGNINKCLHRYVIKTNTSKLNELRYASTLWLSKYAKYIDWLQTKKSGLE